MLSHVKTNTPIHGRRRQNGSSVAMMPSKAMSRIARAPRSVRDVAKLPVELQRLLVPRVVIYYRAAARRAQCGSTSRIIQQVDDGLGKAAAERPYDNVDVLLHVKTSNAFWCCHDRLAHCPGLQDLVLDSRAFAQR